jgi:acyl-CoA thioester hydrolase
MDERFAFSYDVRVHWGEIDRMGHLNNAMYARYIESARVEYFAAVGLCDARSAAPPPSNLVPPRSTPDGVGPIVARIAIDFRRPVVHPDTIRVHVATTRIGRSSATHRYVLASAAQGGAVVAEGEVVWVVLDYEKGEPLPMPAPLRERIVALEASAGRKVAGA